MRAIVNLPTGSLVYSSAWRQGLPRRTCGKATEGIMSPFVFNHRSERYPVQATTASSWTLPVRPLRL